MISEKDFVLTLNRIRKVVEFYDNLADVFINNKETAPTYPTCLDEAIFALDSCFPNNEDEWVAYWVYDLNFGKHYKEGAVMVNDEYVELSTADKLYNFLINLTE